VNPERYDLKLDLENTNTNLISLSKKSDTANTFGFDDGLLYTFKDYQ